jgi:hypothetical protein
MIAQFAARGSVGDPYQADACGSQHRDQPLPSHENLVVPALVARG